MKNLPADFKPSELTYNNLRKHGAIPEFVDDELEMFKSYFLDPDLPSAKAKKKSWQMTCQRWMRQAWKGKAGRDWEYDRHNRYDNRHIRQDNAKPTRARRFKTILSPAAQAIQDINK